MMAVAVELQPTFRARPPRMLFEGQFARIGWGQANDDVAADGRFLMIKGEEQPLPNALKVVFNRADELRRTVPPDAPR